MNHAFANCPRCSAPVTESDRMCFICGQVLSEPETGAVQQDSQPAPDPSTAEAPLPAPPPQAPPPDLQDVQRTWAAATEAPPWEERRRHGFLAALWLTWRDSVFRPVPFFRALPPRSGMGPAIGYTLIVSAIALFFNFYWETVRTVLGGGAEGSVAATLLGGLLTLLLFGGLLLALYLGMLFVMVALLHVGLMIAGAGRFGYEATFRSTCYASGPAAFAVFPFFGPILGLVWGSVVLFIAVREAQRTTNGRAALAFLIPFLAMFLFVLLLGVLFALLIGTTDLTAV